MWDIDALAAGDILANGDILTLNLFGVDIRFQVVFGDLTDNFLLFSNNCQKRVSVNQRNSESLLYDQKSSYLVHNWVYRRSKHY